MNLISCESSAKQTIHMKCKDISLKNTNDKSNVVCYQFNKKSKCMRSIRESTGQLTEEENEQNNAKRN